MMLAAAAFALLVAATGADHGGDFTLSIVHLNDFHSRFDPVSAEFTSCAMTCLPFPCPRGREETCVGGIARVMTAVEKLRQQWPNNSVFLNAGDNFQGSLFYKVHRHAIMSFFLNRFPYDAIALGNHEFDQGVENVKRFVRRLRAPVVAANIDTTDDPEFGTLIHSSVRVNRGGRKIGIIGYTLSNLADVSDTHRLRFHGALKAVNEEAASLKRQGVDIIICLSHSGLGTDKLVAKEAPEVDVIVGGHTHHFLYSGPPPAFDPVRGSYPEVVVQASGRRVPVVQAFAGTKYLGHILVTFNSSGEVTGWRGKPLLLDSSVPEDSRVLQLLDAWRPAVRRVAERRVGFLRAQLSQDEFACATGECALGNLIADAYVDLTTRGVTAEATVGAVAGWSIMANLGPGWVTYEDVFNVLPYEYTVDTFDIMGRDLLAAIESSAEVHGIFQWSGVVMFLNASQPEGSRVLDVFVRTDPGQQPDEYPPLNPGRRYRAVAQSVSLSGGYANPVLRERHQNRVTGPMEYDVVANYLSEHPGPGLSPPSGYDLRRMTLVDGRSHPTRFSGLSKNGNHRKSFG